MGYKEPDKNRYKRTLNLKQLFDFSAKLKRMGVIDQAEQLQIYSRWPEIVGVEVAKNSRPLKLRDRVLSVAVKNHTWMQQLTMLKPAMFAAIEKELGKGMVREIRLTTRDYLFQPPEKP